MGCEELISSNSAAPSPRAFPWRIVFFTANITACALLLELAAIPLLRTPDEIGIVVLFIVIFGVPSLAVGIAEIALICWRTRWLERPLGVIAGLVGMLAFLLLLTNSIEALTKPVRLPASFWLGFIPACLVISAYCGWCCWMRVMKLTIPAQYGFEVGGEAVRPHRRQEQHERCKETSS